MPTCIYRIKLSISNNMLYFSNEYTNEYKYKYLFINIFRF